MPQIGLTSPLRSSTATAAPICRAAGEPIVVGQALPARFTQSMPSSFVSSSGRSKPCSFVARKFEQKRWKF